MGKSKATTSANAEAIAVESTTPAYLLNVRELECLDISKNAVKGHTRSAILHNFTLSRGRVTAIFQLPDYTNETTWFRWKEARTVIGVQNTADLQYEFMKTGYSTALENLSHESTTWKKVGAVLFAKGFDKTYFETVYKCDPLVNKMYYILRDAGLLNKFKEEMFDMKRMEGSVMDVRWSSLGNLMSPKGEENGTAKAIPASDSAITPADYESTRVEFDI